MIFEISRNKNGGNSQEKIPQHPIAVLKTSNCSYNKVSCWNDEKQTIAHGVLRCSADFGSSARESICMRDANAIPMQPRKIAGFFATKSKDAT